MSLSRALLGLVLTCSSCAALAQDITGIWQGTLRIGPTELRLAFHIDAAGDGSYSGSLDSIDQGVNGIPLSSASVDRSSVEFVCSQVGGTFTGTLQADGKSIAGSWKQGPATLPLTLSRSDELPVLNRPQEPKPPFPYRVLEVSFSNPDAEDVTLSATLTLPEGEGPFPAAVLISGSGPQDRDEALMGHKPFLVLADHLTRNGIAVLRADDRGVAKSTGNFATATLDDFVSDALAGAEFLRARDDIDEIGLIGHSEGGIAAPRASLRSDEVAFAVLLAGTAVPGDELLIAQGEAVMRAMGVGDPIIQRSKEIQGTTFAILEEEPENDAARVRLLALYDELTPEEKTFSGLTEETYAAQVEAILTPWFRNLLQYDPRAALTEMTCPVFAVFGSKDVQVPVSQNEPEMRKALAKHPDATIRVFDGLNHLFQPAGTGAPSEYGTIETTLSLDVLEAVSDWILERSNE